MCLSPQGDLEVLKSRHWVSKSCWSFPSKIAEWYCVVFTKHYHLIFFNAWVSSQGNFSFRILFEQKLNSTNSNTERQRETHLELGYFLLQCAALGVTWEKQSVILFQDHSFQFKVRLTSWVEWNVLLTFIFSSCLRTSQITICAAFCSGRLRFLSGLASSDTWGTSKHIT